MIVDMIVLLVATVALAFGIAYTFVCVVLAFRGEDVGPALVWRMSIGWAMFIVIMYALEQAGGPGECIYQGMFG